MSVTMTDKARQTDGDGRRSFKELEVERILLREPRQGRVRAALEFAPPRDPDAEVRVPVVRFSLLTPTGEPALVAEVDEAGRPSLFIGNPDCGTTVSITPAALDLWSDGNIVASLRSSETGGGLELFAADGRTLVDLPAGAAPTGEEELPQTSSS